MPHILDGPQIGPADLADDTQPERAQPLLDQQVGLAQRGTVGDVIKGKGAEIDQQQLQADRVLLFRALGDMVDQRDQHHVRQAGQAGYEEQPPIGLGGSALKQAQNIHASGPTLVP